MATSVMPSSQGPPGTPGQAPSTGAAATTPEDDPEDLEPSSPNSNAPSLANKPVPLGAAQLPDIRAATAIELSPPQSTPSSVSRALAVSSSAAGTANTSANPDAYPEPNPEPRARPDPVVGSSESQPSNSLTAAAAAMATLQMSALHAGKSEPEPESLPVPAPAPAPAPGTLAGDSVAAPAGLGPEIGSAGGHALPRPLQGFSAGNETPPSLGAARAAGNPRRSRTAGGSADGSRGAVEHNLKPDRSAVARGRGSMHAGAAQVAPAPAANHDGDNHSISRLVTDPASLRTTTLMAQSHVDGGPRTETYRSAAATRTLIGSLGRSYTANSGNPGSVSISGNPSGNSGQAMGQFRSEHAGSAAAAAAHRASTIVDDDQPAQSRPMATASSRSRQGGSSESALELGAGTGGPGGAGSHSQSTAQGGSTESQASQRSGTTSSSIDSTDPAMFAKRDVNQIASHKSTSALSSFSSQASALKQHRHKFHRHHNYPDHGNQAYQGPVGSGQAAKKSSNGNQNQQRHDNMHHAVPEDQDQPDASVLGTSCDCACPSPPSSPPLHTNDQMRIRTPASAVPSRRNSIEIGTRMPFSNRTANAEDKLAPADSFLRDTESARPSRNYEPAKAIMSTPSSPQRSRNASVVGLRGSAGSTANSSTTLYRRDSGGSSAGSSSEANPGLVKSPTQASSGLNTTMHTSPSSRANSRSDSATDSLTDLPLRGRNSQGEIHQPAQDDLSRAPVRASRAPLKQLRDPKQPIYIPAVLRPTEETSYQPAGRFASQSAPHASTILPPGRSHWRPDSSRDDCRACSRKFTLFDRRHHCRKCGDLFCSQDSRFLIGIDQNLDFNLFGYPARACRTCSDSFTHSVLEASRLATDATQLASGPGPQGISIGQRLENPEAQIAGSLVTNLPADWNWSTF